MALPSVRGEGNRIVGIPTSLRYAWAAADWMPFVQVVHTGPLRVAQGREGDGDRLPVVRRRRRGRTADPPAAEGIRGPGRTPLAFVPAPALSPYRGSRRSPQAPAAVHGPGSSRAASAVAEVTRSQPGFPERSGRWCRCRGHRRPFPRSRTRAGRPHPGAAPAGAELPGCRGRRAPGAVPSGQCPGPAGSRLPPGAPAAALRPRGVPSFPAGLAALSTGARAEAPSRSSPGVHAAPMWFWRGAVLPPPLASARRHVRPRLSHV